MLITLIMIDIGYELQARSREEGTSYKLAPAEGVVSSWRVTSYKLALVRRHELQARASGGLVTSYKLALVRRR